MVEFDRLILPGGRGKITLGVMTDGYLGHVAKTAQVNTNDPDRASFTLTMEMTVKPIFSAKPFDQIFISTPVGKPVRQTITLTNNLSHAVEIVALEHDLPPGIQVELAVREKGRIYEVTLGAPADRPMQQEGLITLKLSGAPAATTVLPAQVSVWTPKK